MPNKPLKLDRVIESLSPLERKIIAYLNLSLKEIIAKTGLDETSMFRALKFLENKGVVKVNKKKKRIIELGTNGIYYKKNNLPERALLACLEKKDKITLEEAKKNSKLTDNEFKVSLGVLKSKSFIEIKNGKIFIMATREELTKRTAEELFIESLPLEELSLSEKQKNVLKSLRSRKNIIGVKEKTFVSFELTESGREIVGKELRSDFLEEVTPEIIRNWKRGLKFRKYDIHAKVPRIFGGRSHIVSEAISKGKKIWIEMGFKEMSSSLVQTSFWNFDALFTAQDHPVREMQDSFYIKNLAGALPEKTLVNNVKKAHESGVGGSKGWQYKWNEEEAKRIVLRTHTTCISVHELAQLEEAHLPAKFFAIGRNFRNETVDWSHGFEFNQSEGIVVDKNANFKHLLGYLKEFYKKMGFEKIRFTPAYFPYTEPSLEVSAYHEEKKRWIELGGAGIFRPEVTAPLLGKPVPVLAWGPGFDRLMMLAVDIKDMREIYQNDIKFLRERRVME